MEVDIKDVYESLSKRERRKFKYFRTFLNNPIKPKVLCFKAENDDDKEFFRELALSKHAPDN